MLNKKKKKKRIFWIIANSVKYFIYIAYIFVYEVQYYTIIPFKLNEKTDKKYKK